MIVKKITKTLVNAALYLHRKAIYRQQDAATRADLRAHNAVFQQGVVVRAEQARLEDVKKLQAATSDAAKQVFKDTAAELRILPKEYL